MYDSYEAADGPGAGAGALMCPCPTPFRLLQQQDNSTGSLIGGGQEQANGNGDDGAAVLWEILYTCGVLLLMLVALVSDRIGADSVMLAALAAFMAAEIITIKEGIAGFSNEGVLTVLALFVVAEGISKTGALDWYLGKLLGRPKSSASAQLRLMLPITVVSAFLNNTPIVTVMMPIVQRWAKNVRIPVQQLLIPLSFASILGGTCTLIGTSTNLVVVGLLDERYKGDSAVSINLFGLGLYGVPVAIAGVAYVLFASPFLLPGGVRGDRAGTAPTDNQEDLLLGARLAPWSPAVGRSVKRSGLRDTGGIYLVSVHRATTGNIHRAVGQEFVLGAGDILYFTGLVEGFGEFCEEHGLEVLTQELQASAAQKVDDEASLTKLSPTHDEDLGEMTDDDGENNGSHKASNLPSIAVNERLRHGFSAVTESLSRADEAEQMRIINRMADLIHGTTDQDKSPTKNGRIAALAQPIQEPAAPKVAVAYDHDDIVIIGIDTPDRPGLLLDVSKGLLRLGLSLRHTEASVVDQRSISIWRCALINMELPDPEEIWSVLSALLENEGGIRAPKKRGLRVIRAVITKTSSLVGKQAASIDFRNRYKAAVVAIQKGGRNASSGTAELGPGDVLVLQVNEDSPLLRAPPADFYKKKSDGAKYGRWSRSRGNMSANPPVNENAAMPSVSDLSGSDAARRGDDVEVGAGLSAQVDSENQIVPAGLSSDTANTINDETVWGDLHVHLVDDGDNGNAREFLTAMQVAPGSKLAKRTVADLGLDKLPGVFLVSIDRPVDIAETPTRIGAIDSPRALGSDFGSLRSTEDTFTTISPDAPLKAGDVLWFAGSASAVGDLRKIPGLRSFENDEVEKINEKIHDRRLVEAVIARRGPLVGKTVKEARFRTRFGAAVISVHRDGRRIHEHPGNIKLQAGDVLLLEAGPTFIRHNLDNGHSFALLAEVEDSAPPRLSLLIPALVITAAMIAIFTSRVAKLLICALVASILMVILGILSEQEARDAINWEIYITIASAFGIGTAMVNSGVAGGVANFLVDVGGALGIGDAGLLGAVYFATFLISNVVTNNAAAALLFPIALNAAEKTGIDRVIMSYCLMLGASASFMTPYGYTTNLLVYGPGGYKYVDFLSIGLPMQIVLWVLSILFLTMDPARLWVSWLGTSAVLVVVVSVGVLGITPSRLLGKSKQQAATSNHNTTENAKQ